MNEVIDEIYENETAEELYERIQKEKERLILEGKLKKQKKLPEISEDEIPFEIPKSWKWVYVSQISDIYTGNSIPESVKKSKYFNINQGYDYIGTKDVGFDGRVNYDNGVKIPFVEEKFRLARKNSILMCIEGGSAGKKIAFLDKEVCFGNKLCCFNTFILNSKYLYYYFNSLEFAKSFKSKINGLIGGVGVGKLQTILIPLPPLCEQRRISELVDRLFKKLDEAKEKALSVLNTFELRKAKILHLAIQGKLSKQLDEYGTAEELYEKIQQEKENLISEGKLKKQKKLPEISEDEILFEIPKSWKWVRLGEISNDIHYGYTASANLEGNSKLLRITDIQNNKVDWNNVPFCYIDNNQYLKYALNNGDILIARTGGTVGKSYMVEFLSDDVVFASYLIRIVVSRRVNSKYLKYFMESTLYWNQIRCGTMGTGQPNVNAVTLSKLSLPLSPLVEQENIVKILNNIFEKEEKAKKLIEATLDKIELVKKSILNSAVRGRI